MVVTEKRRTEGAEAPVEDSGDERLVELFGQVAGGASEGGAETQKLLITLSRINTAGEGRDGRQRLDKGRLDGLKAVTFGGAKGLDGGGVGGVFCGAGGKRSCGCGGCGKSGIFQNRTTIEVTHNSRSRRHCLRGACRSRIT